MQNKLPIGISTFSTIRTEGYIYVDKTALIQQLIEQGRYYFLSRPRRFGKSLLVDTLKELFEGNEALFHGLAVHPSWDWSKRHPVIHISFNDGVHTDREQLDRSIRHQLEKNAIKLGVSLKPGMITQQFEQLIEEAAVSFGQPAVVLIDEYDKPIIDQIQDKAQAAELRDGLKNLYSVLKGRDQFIRFVLLTGVSKFSQVSLFSGLNTLNDITVSRPYSALCGYTQTELDNSFDSYLEGIDKQKMRHWYNGYRWLGESVYNPYDVMLFLQDKTYRSYWFATATPTFLIKLLKEGRYFLPELESFEVQESSLGSFEVDSMSAEVLLFQTGYLTIKEVVTRGDQLRFVLGYPNREVKLSFNTHLLAELTPPSARPDRFSLRIYDALAAAKLDAFKTQLQQFFSSIPHDWYRNNRLDQYEGYYASLFYSHMVACGAQTTPEDTTSLGQIDLTVVVDEKVYIFEFKVIHSEVGDGSALRQIKQNAYADKYSDVRELYLVGIEFSKSLRNIVGFDVERGGTG